MKNPRDMQIDDYLGSGIGYLGPTLENELSQSAVKNTPRSGQLSFMESQYDEYGYRADSLNPFTRWRYRLRQANALNTLWDGYCLDHPELLQRLMSQSAAMGKRQRKHMWATAFSQWKQWWLQDHEVRLQIEAHQEEARRLQEQHDWIMSQPYAPSPQEVQDRMAYLQTEVDRLTAQRQDIHPDFSVMSDATVTP